MGQPLGTKRHTATGKQSQVLIAAVNHHMPATPAWVRPELRDADRDHHAPQPSDPPGRGDWRNRMGGDDAKTIYKERAATAECASAQARIAG
jgi:hypothetical protein